MTCLPTALWMMHKWYLEKSGTPNQKPMFDNIVNVSQRQFINQGSPMGGGVPGQELADLIRWLRLTSENIEISPPSFQRLLNAHGPFVYIESSPIGVVSIQALINSAPSARNFSHAVLITGVIQKQSLFTIFFNDPGTGKNSHSEFFDFVANTHKPAGGARSMVIYIGR